MTKTMFLGLLVCLFGALVSSAAVPSPLVAKSLNASLSGVSLPNGAWLEAASSENSSFVGPKLVARKFLRYHDNYIHFDHEITRNRYVQFLEYKVTEFYISIGQDPDGLNYVGDVHPIVKDDFLPALRFHTGRHGSRDTADWWNTRMDPQKTTFRHPAKKLNMAFIGDLVVRTSWVDTNLTTFVLPDVGFAQGHSWTSNNWWFGSYHAFHSATDSNAIAIAVDEPPMCIGFKRGSRDGGTKVNMITIMVRDRSACNHY